MADPGRVLFLNENLGGHASMHLWLRAALEDLAPDLDVEFRAVPAAGLARRALATEIPGLGPLDLDLAPLRFQVAQSVVARRILRRARPYDLLHVYTQNVALCSVDLLAAGPSVVSTDATTTQGAYHLPYRRPTRFTAPMLVPSQRVEQRVYDAATLVVAQSEWAASSLRSVYGVAPERLFVIPFGLEPGPPPDHRPPAGLPEVTFVGTNLDRKGGLRLLRAFRARLRGRCVLNLVTRDRVAPEPGVTVHSDYVPGDPRLVELLARSAVFAFPTEMDNSPYSVLEAMRAGLPVVTTRVGALPEMVLDGETGVLVPHDDDALGRAIGGLLADPDRARRMGDAGRARLESVFDARVTTAALLDVLVEARARHARTAAAR
jgi:glycosyltransferase involved in cell wall biosynthesis